MRRWTVGTGGDDEPGLILVGDLERHQLILRGSDISLPQITELVNAANDSDRWRSLADRLGEAIEDSSYHNHPILAEWRRAKGEKKQ